MKNIKFAIEYLKNNSHKMAEENNNYAVQTSNMSIEALEKQMPKKPVKDREYTLCPNCKKVEIDWLDNYCHGCGQRLDWSVEK